MEVDSPDVQTFEAVQKALALMCKDQGTRIIAKTPVEGRAQFVVKTCACLKLEPSISELIESNNCLAMAPVVYTGGWEQHRVIGFQDHDLRNLLKNIDKIGKAEVVYKRQIPEESVRDNFTISINSFLGGLTQKQTEALIIALQNGYYSIPKQVTTEEFGDETTCPENHLRGAREKS